jgi:dynein light chain LC8-type
LPIELIAIFLSRFGESDHEQFEAQFIKRSGRSTNHVKVDKMTVTEKKAVIKNVDMTEDMQDDAINTSLLALDKYNIEKDIAAFIKKEFDKKYSPTWHCIVGRNFGSYVTHETKNFIYFYLGQVAILLFKSG